MVLAEFFLKKIAEEKSVSGRHVDLNMVENYLRHKRFPDGISEKEDKANFRRTCKKFSLVNGKLMYKGNRLVITDKQRGIDIIHDAHQGLGDNAKAVAMSSHLGRTSPYQKVSRRFYWYTIVNDVTGYIKGCDKCQKHLAMPQNVKEELKSIPVPSEVMKQIGVDICSLPMWMDLNISLFV